MSLIYKIFAYSNQHPANRKQVRVSHLFISTNGNNHHLSFKQMKLLDESGTFNFIYLYIPS